MIIVMFSSEGEKKFEINWNSKKELEKILKKEGPYKNYELSVEDTQKIIERFIELN